MISGDISFDYTTGYSSWTVFASGINDVYTYSVEDFSDENLTSGSVSSAMGDWVSVDATTGYGSGSVFSSSA